MTVPLVLACFLTGYYYVRFAQLLDDRLHGARQRTFPRVFARPLELRRGQALTDLQLIDRLNDLGYAQRPVAERPGEFAVGDGSIFIHARARELSGKTVRVTFRPPAQTARTPAARRPPPKPPRADRVQRLEVGDRPSEQLVLDTPLLTSLTTGEREKRRPVALAAIPDRMVQAVLAVEDHRYYDHPGVDPISMVRAVVTNMVGKQPVRLGRQHHHPAGGPQRLPAAVRRVDAAARPPAIRLGRPAAQADRAVPRAHPEHAARRRTRSSRST